MKKGQVLEGIRVTSYANEGRCVARKDGKVLFIKGAVPGEEVTIQIIREKKDWMEAVVLAVTEPSQERRQPFCQHFGICGGCQWQHLVYEAQLKYKQASVSETLERLGKVIPKTVLPIAGCEVEQEYRNKLEFTFSHREWMKPEAWNRHAEQEDRPALGYHLPGAFDRVFDVKECRLQPQLSDRIRLAVKTFAVGHGYSFFHLKRHTGLLRTMMIRMTTAGEVMVLVVFAENDPEKIAALMNHLQRTFPGITSLLYCINGKENDTIYDLEVKTWSGRDHIIETLCGLVFRISAKSFFQTNTRQAEKLYECVKDFASLHGGETVYDLYTGTGSIALFLSSAAGKVVGIDSVHQAIEDARSNAVMNGISNTYFMAGDMARTLQPPFIIEHGRPSVVITDPPRAGMQPEVIRSILGMLPEKVVYVSCNVATQARDMQLLSGRYSVNRIRPFDLFPQTHHIENVAELNLIS